MRENHLAGSKTSKAKVTKLTSTLEVTLDFEFLFSFVLDTFSHLGISVALVLTGFVVVVVVVAVTVFADVLARLFQSSHLALGPGINEFHHADYIVGPSLARCATRIGRTQSKFDEVLSVQQTSFLLLLIGKLDQTATSLVLDGVFGNESYIALLVESTSRGQQTFSKLGVGLHLEVRDDKIGLGFSSDKGKKKSSGAEHSGN